MSTQTSSRFNCVISKITKAANSAVKTKDALKAYQQKSIKSIKEMPVRRAGLSTMEVA